MSITVNALPHEKRKTPPSELGFGRVFTDHMFTQYYDIDLGWHDAEIGPYHSFTLDPASMVFHYAQEVFEGLKAYHTPNGRINLFRPEMNARRFNRSAERMAMPIVEEDFHVDAIRRLIDLDRAWMPTLPESSIYIRPTMIATSVRLGLGASDQYIHYIIAGPVGPYFNGRMDPVSVYISNKYRRSCIGGVGEAKTGGNYAASLYVSEQVSKLGYSQVLWLDAAEGRYVEEVGAMNICFVYEGGKIVTPELCGSILHGVTRDSLLTLAPTLGYEVSEERIAIDRVISDIQNGKITEVFGCGTAAVISPVGRLGLDGKDYVINNNEPGPVARRLYDELTGIQLGTREDRFGWVQSI